MIVLHDWSALPDDLLDEISKRFTTMKDFVRFGAVCVSWRSTFILNRKRKFPRQLPVMMIPGTKRENSQRFCNLPSERGRRGGIYDFREPVPFKKFVKGSNHGWLVVAQEIGRDVSVQLLNPFLSENNKIELPVLSSLKIKASYDHRHSHHNLKKVVLSHNPSTTSNYAVMVIHGALEH
ncbi:hypothetical protein GIB67_010540 [Kingdonia uniflora]|uniref:KIB1-4 beta-propeller domain-containing protein n=1 Tax=Kingdonia uniflora TaxID=39325 RepID=A0A7J7MAP8_9MAGN|nr:hypothetical protein GIB67_010540 [Kingdonia uniflora]